MEGYASQNELPVVGDRPEKAARGIGQEAMSCQGGRGRLERAAMGRQQARMSCIRREGEPEKPDGCRLVRMSCQVCRPAGNSYWFSPAP